MTLSMKSGRIRRAGEHHLFKVVKHALTKCFNFRKSMSKNNSKSLASMRQKLRKYNKEFEKDLTAFREAPDAADDDDDAEKGTNKVNLFIYVLIVPFLTDDGDSDDSDAKPSFKKSAPKQEAEKFAKVSSNCKCDAK